MFSLALVVKCEEVSPNLAFLLANLSMKFFTIVLLNG